MQETVYAMQYTVDGIPMSIGTITEQVYQMIYNDMDEKHTNLNRKTNRLEKTLYTDNYTIYKLARQLHRVSL